MVILTKYILSIPLVAIAPAFGIFTVKMVTNTNSIINHLHLVFWPNKIHSINFLVKFLNFYSLLSACAWLLKWHKCISVIYIIMGITEKFYLFCNFRASCSTTVPAVLNLFWYCFEHFEAICKLIIWLNCDIDIDCWLFEHCATE